DPHHLSVLRLIQMVTENAHKNGIWVGICGELGADLTLTTWFDRKQAENAATNGNGRMARNTLEKAILNQSKRL
ncbi:hypothetical protein H6B10_17220, partial [Gemmiger formicilis]|uniref:putative PEP-binding protein n=1 Tax=Gemmiger formicilis TaxID=745368 RepID=UPI001D32D548|nr:hypothetical protein [Gemmiger formicilis]